jgi:hypothetical protein
MLRDPELIALETFRLNNVLRAFNMGETESFSFERYIL